MTKQPWKNRHQGKIPVPDLVKNKGGYRNLMNQINKIARHNRQGSFKTRDRYYQAVERFARHLADRYNLQKFANISGKHIASYVTSMQEKDLSASTIKTDLTAIRFFHDKCERTRYELPTNKDLKEKYQIRLEKRSFGGVDRTWSNREFQGMVRHAEKLGRTEVAHMMKLARYQGLRLHEAVRLDRAAAERAMRHNALTIKGKGGLVRTIPVREETKTVFKEVMKNTERGEKLFVPENRQAHEVMKSVQSFIVHHRDSFASPDRESDLTFHGLRHTYADEEYRSRIEIGFSEKEARLEVANLLGHGRDDVTRIYLT